MSKKGRRKMLSILSKQQELNRSITNESSASTRYTVRMNIAQNATSNLSFMIAQTTHDILVQIMKGINEQQRQG